MRLEKRAAADTRHDRKVPPRRDATLQEGPRNVGRRHKSAVVEGTSKAKTAGREAKSPGLWFGGGIESHRMRLQHRGSGGRQQLIGPPGDIAQQLQWNGSSTPHAAVNKLR